MPSLLVDGSCRQSDPTMYPVRRKDEAKRVTQKIRDMGLLCQTLQIIIWDRFVTLCKILSGIALSHFANHYLGLFCHTSQIIIWDCFVTLCKPLSGIVLSHFVNHYLGLLCHNSQTIIWDCFVTLRKPLSGIVLSHFANHYLVPWDKP